MPSKTRSSRKRKYQETDDSENEELESQTSHHSAKRRKTKHDTNNKNNKNKSKRTSQRIAKQKRSPKKQTEEPESSIDINSDTDSDTSEFEIKPSKKRTKNKSKKGTKPKPKPRSSPQSKNKNNANTSNNTTAEEEDEALRLVVLNGRVETMYNWLIGNTSWKTVKDKLQKWADKESDEAETENYAKLTLDVLNLILYCGGMRVYKLGDISSIELDSLEDSDKDVLIKRLENGMDVSDTDVLNYQELDPQCLGVQDGNDDDCGDEDDGGDDRDDEKAEILNSKMNKKKKQKAKTSFTIAYRILYKDPMLWNNGTRVVQERFASKYRQLLSKLVDTFESRIYKNDDFLIGCVLKWCDLFARKFRIRQFRKLGTYTAFCIAQPLVSMMNSNRISKCAQCELLDLRKTKRKKKVSIQKNISEFDDRITNLEGHVAFVFDRIAAYKTQDCDETIRCWVLQNIVSWINSDPSVDSFMKSKYWHYLHRALKDDLSAKVRVCALTQLQELFDYEHVFHGKKKSGAKSGKSLDLERFSVLDDLLRRIMPSLNVLLRDSDANVASTCIAFFNLLLVADVLDSEDGDVILSYIFDGNASVRKQAALFVYYDTFAEEAVIAAAYDNDNSAEEDSCKDNIAIDAANKRWDDVYELIQLIQDRAIDLGCHVSANNVDFCDGKRGFGTICDYVVASMSCAIEDESFAVLRDFDLLFSILRDSISEKRRPNSKKGQVSSLEFNDRAQLDDIGQTCLCYLILSCMRMVNGDLDSLRDKSGRVIPKLGNPNWSSCVACIAESLHTFSADFDKLYPLILMIALIPIDAFSGNDNMRHFGSIYKCLQSVFVRHDPSMSDVSDVSDKTSDDRQKQLMLLNMHSRKEIALHFHSAIARVFVNFGNSSHLYVLDCAAIIVDIISDLVDEFFVICKEKTLDLAWKQRLYCNLSKQYSFSKCSDIAQLCYFPEMHSLSLSLQVQTIDIDHSISLSIFGILLISISWKTGKLNFKMCDANDSRELSFLKDSLAQMTSYYVNTVLDDNDCVIESQLLLLSSAICSALDTFSIFQKLNGQSSALNGVFNDCAMDSDTLAKLLLIFEFVLRNSNENSQICWIVCVSRLCLMNNSEYASFGALLVSRFHSKTMSVRINSLIHDFIRVLNEMSHSQLQLMLFDALAIVISDSNVTIGDRQVVISKMCKSIALIKGMQKLPSAYFNCFLFKMIDNLSQYYHYCNSIFCFIVRASARDQLAVWERYQALDDLDLQNNQELMAFHEKLKAIATKAAKKRNVTISEKTNATISDLNVSVSNLKVSIAKQTTDDDDQDDDDDGSEEKDDSQSKRKKRGEWLSRQKRR